MSWRDAHRARVMELERQAAAIMLAAMGRILDGIADRFATVTAAAEDQASFDDLSGITAEWQAAVHNEVLPWFAGIYEAGGDAAAEQVRALGMGIVVPDPDPELMDLAAANYLAQAEQRFYGLGDEVWTAARAQLVEGFAAGEGVGELRRRISDVTGLGRAQAEALARTEVIAASNLGADAAVELMGDNAPPYKQWLATMDGRTRLTHRHADGQVVPRAEPFQVGFARLQVPGDPTGPADEVVNCRCTTLYLDTAEPIDVDTPGRGQGGIVDQVFRDTDGGTELPEVASAWRTFLRATSGTPASLKKFRQNDVPLEVAPPLTAAAEPGPEQVDSTTGEPHTGAMVALVPADPEALAVEGGEPPEALHLTLAYLGDGAAMPSAAVESLTRQLEAMAEVLPPIEARVFGAALWNTLGEEPSAVWSVGGDDLPYVHDLTWTAIHRAMVAGGPEALWEPPTQHSPWVAHVCAGYGPATLWSPAELAEAREGPLVFDRLRLAVGGGAMDFPLMGQVPEEEDEDMTPDQARAAGRAAALASGGIVPVRTPTGLRITAPSLRIHVPEGADPVALGRAIAGDLAHLTGLTAATMPTDGPEPQPGEHLRIVMTVLGESTGGDGTGRTFVNTEYREPPFSFNYQLRSSAHGGLPEVVHVGNVVRVVEDGARLWGFVTLDLDQAEGAEYARRAVAGFERWASIGLDEKKPRITLVWPEPTDEPDPDDPNPDTELYEPDATIFDGGRIGELTGVSFPALADALVEPTAELLSLYGAPVEAEVPEVPAEPESVPVAASASGCGCGGACGGCSHPATPADHVQAITAASMTITLRELPPAEWYREPVGLPMDGALNLDDHGRVWGMLAPLGTGHRAYARGGARRLEAPTGNVDYSRFMGAWGATADGLVPAGPMTMDCGHYPIDRVDHEVAPAHYENACSVFATVAAGEMSNGRGVWVAGALRQGVTPEHVARALACRCSGDWQPHPDRPGWQELVACLLVPSPGFGSEHPETVYEGGALVASSVPVRHTPSGRAFQRHEVAAVYRRAAGVVAMLDAAGCSPADRVLRTIGDRT